MPNGHGPKEYGGHNYGPSGMDECQHKCGCWMGSSNSGGPLGLDPFGVCPGNPKDGKKLGGQADYHQVVEQRISDLQSRASRAEDLLKRVKPSKVQLAEDLKAANRRVDELRTILLNLHRRLGEDLERTAPKPKT